MEFLGTLIFILIIFSFVFYILYNQLRLFYNRNLRTYKNEIRTFLESKNYVLVDTISPNDKDWQRSPFSKPVKFEFSFLLTHPLNWNNTEYFKIIGNKGEKNQEFWIEINTTYFHKPVLTFKVGHKININDSENTYTENIIIVKDKCPACGFMLFNNEKICPDCGLNFE